MLAQGFGKHTVAIHMSSDGFDRASDTKIYGTPDPSSKIMLAANDKARQLARFPEYTLYSQAVTEGRLAYTNDDHGSAIKGDDSTYLSIATAASVTHAELEGFLCALAQTIGFASHERILDALASAAKQTQDAYKLWRMSV